MQCTCGSVLPDDARFCHKCGKPQYDEDIARLEPPPAPPPVAAPRIEPPPITVATINFANRRAVALSGAVAMLALFVFTLFSAVIPLVAGILILPLFALAGFASATLYARQTGESVSTKGGARLGFMTGLWAYLVLLLLSIAVAVVVANPQWRAEMVTQLSTQHNPALDTMLKMLNDPSAFLSLLMGELVVYFCLLTLPSILGGVLGVKLQARK